MQIGDVKSAKHQLQLAEELAANDRKLRISTTQYETSACPNKIFFRAILKLRETDVPAAYTIFQDVASRCTNSPLFLQSESLAVNNKRVASGELVEPIFAKFVKFC